MGRTGEEMCRLCTGPAPIRTLVERLRTAELSQRDCAAVLKAIRDVDISHTSIMRHDTHFSRRQVAEETPEMLDPEDITITTVARHKLSLYWKAHGNVIPTDSEARAWMKLLSEMQQAETEATKMRMLKEMFTIQPKQLPDVIEGVVVT